jgi:hypothetical protein
MNTIGFSYVIGPHRRYDTAAVLLFIYLFCWSVEFDDLMKDIM